MQKGIVIGHNTGLGDLIIMNGAIRYLAEKYDKVYLVTWENRAKHAKFLYRDNPKIEVYVKPSIASSKQGILRMEAAYNEIVSANRDFNFGPYRRCFWNLQDDWKKFAIKMQMPSGTIFPRIFYGIVGVPYEARYKYHRIERDNTREQDLYDRLNLKQPYAFVINDSRSSKYNFNFQTNLPKVNPLDFEFWKDTLIFDWQKVIENADELHMINTSWFHLARTMQLKVPKYYYTARKVEMCEQNEEFLNDEFDSGWLKIDPKCSIKDKPKWWLD